MAFSRARNFDLHRPTFIDQSQNYQVNVANGRVSPIAQTAPSTSQMFTGREQYLEALKSHFKPEDPNDLTRKYFLLYGMGGIGKTQICLKYTDDTEDQYDYTFWIDTSSEETVMQSLKDIFKSYQSNGAWEFSPAVSLNWISNLKCKWLMIFDNADGSPKIVEKFLPPKNKGNILITSRNQALNKITTSEHSMEVTEMDEPTAVQLLLKVSGLYQQFDLYKDIAKKIVSELYGIPLAIDHAGAYIMSGSCDIADFLKIYKKQRMKLLDNKKFSGASKYDKTVYSTFEISYQNIVQKSEDKTDIDAACSAKYALVIINMSAFLHHEKIPHAMFQRAAENYDVTIEEYSTAFKCCIVKDMDKYLFNLDENGDWNESLFLEAVALLYSYSLIKRQGPGGHHGIHPLIKNWCQDRSSTAEVQLWISNTTGMVATSIKDEDTIEEHAYNKTIAIHVGEILVYRDVQDSYQDCVVLTKLAESLSRAGMFKTELLIRDSIMQLTQTAVGKDHLATLKSMHYLARVYRVTGKSAEAEELGLKVLKMRTEILGETHSDTFRSMSFLASIFWDNGKLKEAEELNCKTLEMRTRILGEEHPDTLGSMADLACTYRVVGRLKEAEELEIKALEMRTGILGEEHPDTLWNMVNLACTYQKVGRLKEAEELQIKALKMRTRILGEEHPDTLWCMASLAITYQKVGKMKEAEDLKNKTLEMGTRIFSDEHLYTLRWREDLQFVGKVTETKELEMNERHDADKSQDVMNVAETKPKVNLFKKAKLGIKGLVQRKRDH